MPPEVPRRNLSVFDGSIPLDGLAWVAGSGAARCQKRSKQISARHGVTSAGVIGAFKTPRSGPRGLVHGGRAELMLDALEVIEPLDGVIELAPFLLGELGFHLGNRLGELRPIDIL